MDVIETRTATEADFDFLVDVHRQTFQVYVEQLWGWDEAGQRAGLYEDFQMFPFEIIYDRGEAVGMMSVVNQRDALFLNYLAILPTAQRRGLGTHLVRRLMHQAFEQQLPVTLVVLKVNPAKAFYERLGFTVTGDDEYRYFMSSSEGVNTDN
jgi:ribosomal protein S18 acetylase RimI-like enzyme